MAKRTKRSDDLSERPKIRDRCFDLYADIEKGFRDQRQRADDILDYWAMYNCELGSRQFYNGNSKMFVPIVRNAIKARRTRFVNQLFPQSGRYVEVTTTDGDVPHGLMALVEYYVAREKLRTKIMPALMTNGDVEGQYNLYIDWRTVERHVVSRESRPVQVAGVEMPESGEIEELVAETIADAGPSVEVLHDNDVLVLPFTAPSVEDALEMGGSVTILRRWTKARIKEMVAAGEFVEPAGAQLEDLMAGKLTQGRQDIAKELADQAGIKQSGGAKHCLGYETWTKLKVDGEMRLCRIYFASQDILLGVRLNPFWCDRCPLLSEPVEKIPGVFKGLSLIAPIMDMQIGANDTANEAADQGHFAMMPITVADPEQVPRAADLVLDLAAVWEAPPDSIKFLQFPDTTMQALQKIAAYKQEIFQALAVSPAMLPQQTGGGAKTGTKRNQAEIALEQQVELLSTNDAVTVVEGGILTPMVQRFAEYDQQFRDDAILVRSFGQMGRRAIMDEVPPMQLGRRWALRWRGLESTRNAAVLQQKIAFVNVLRGLGPQAYPGYRLNMVPLIVEATEDLWGPMTAPLIFEDEREQLSVDAETENDMLRQGFDLAVHPADDDPKHLQIHTQLMAEGDPRGVIRVHIGRHQQQMKMKQMAQMMAAQGGQGGAPGGRPGIPGKPGVAGTPPGGQPAGPKLLRGPPGMINADRMPGHGAVPMPRKT